MADKIGRSKQPIYNVKHFLDTGQTILDYYRRYKENKTKCDAKRIDLPDDQVEYIKEKVADHLTPDVIIDRVEQKKKSAALCEPFIVDFKIVRRLMFPHYL